MLWRQSGAFQFSLGLTAVFAFPPLTFISLPNVYFVREFRVGCAIDIYIPEVEGRGVVVVNQRTGADEVVRQLFDLKVPRGRVAGFPPLDR